jgi:hypothetical protein
LLESVTITETVEVPAVVGVPVMAPLAASARPAGSELPDATAQVYVPVPPVAARVVEYWTPTVAGGSGDVVVIVGPEATVSEHPVLVRLTGVGVVESWTLRVNG